MKGRYQQKNVKRGQRMNRLAERRTSTELESIFSHNCENYANSIQTSANKLSSALLGNLQRGG